MTAGPTRLHSLDGLRGWAALSVFNFHLFSHFLLYTDALVDQSVFAWATGHTVLGAMFDGDFAVRVFFVISGVALSYAYLGNPDNLRGLRDMALRRYFRLTIPVAASAFVGYLLMSSGSLHHLPASRLTGSESWLGHYYQFEPSLSGVIAFGLRDVYFNPPQSYNPVLWTMAPELTYSFMLFGMLALMHNWPKRRLGYLAVGLMTFSGPGLSFVLGCVMADLDIAMRRRPGPARVPALMPLLVLVAGLAIAVAREPIASALMLPRRPADLLLTAASCAVVWSAMMDGAVRNLLESRLSRLLGHLSFPLYLVHFLVLVSFSSWLLVHLQERGASGVDTFVTTAASSILVTFAASAAFWWLFERTGIRASRAIAKALA